MSLDDRDVEHFVRRFAVLSDPARLRIVSLLLRAGGVSVPEIADALGLEGGEVLAHLAPLLSAGMVGDRSDGPLPRYRVIDRTLEPLCELVCSGLRNPAPAAAGRFVPATPP